MKKVKFLKNHLNFTKGSEEKIEISQQRLNYWVRVGVCEDLGEGSSSANEFDPVARKKELMKLGRTDLNNMAPSDELDPLSFKNKELLADAIVEAETPVIPSEEDVENIDNEDLVKKTGEDEEE